MALLETRGLVKVYGRRAVVDGVNFEVNTGEVVGLLGPNGAGKTTSFRMTMGLITSNAGKVMFNGTDVTRWPMYRRAQLGMSYLSQEPSIFRKLSVEDNLLAILQTMKLSHSRRKMRCEELLTQFGLKRLDKQVAMSLSGGERRRLEIARCLVAEPQLILLDEPFTGVDPMAIADIQDIIKDLRQRGIGVLLTDHSVRETLEITDRSYLLYEGKILTHGTPEQVVNDPMARKFYLGERFDAGHLDGKTRVVAAAAPADSHPGQLGGLLDRDRIEQLIGRLTMDAEYLDAQGELVNIGSGCVPLVARTLESKQRKVRLRAKQTLQQIIGPIDFDPYARADKRYAQLVRLKKRLRLG